jgi:hypothetical protein
MELGVFLWPGFLFVRQRATRQAAIFGAWHYLLPGYYLVMRGAFLYHLANFFAA